MNILSFLFGSPIRVQRNPRGLTADPDELARFTDYFEQQIAPLSRKFENQRVSTLKAARGRIYTGIVLYAGLWLLFLLLHSRGTVLHPLFMLIPLLPIAWWSYRPIKLYQSQVRQQVFPKIFNYFGDDFLFSRDYHMSLVRLKASKILPEYDKASFDDYVQGSYKGIEIAINEVKLVSHEQKDKHVETHTQFQGVMIELSCLKRFNGHTVVIRSRGSVMNFLSSSHQQLSRVKLEDPLFEKQFDVFSTDQIEARFLLTVAFMERLQQLAAFFSSQIQCAFYDNKLLIMLESRQNRFELGSIFKGATFEYEFSQINREMKQLFAIIEVLKLHEYTGL